MAGRTVKSGVVPETVAHTRLVASGGTGAISGAVADASRGVPDRVHMQTVDTAADRILVRTLVTEGALGQIGINARRYRHVNGMSAFSGEIRVATLAGTGATAERRAVRVGFVAAEAVLAFMGQSVKVRPGIGPVVVGQGSVTGGTDIVKVGSGAAVNLIIGVRSAGRDKNNIAAKFGGPGKILGILQHLAGVDHAPVAGTMRVVAILALFCLMRNLGGMATGAGKGANQSGIVIMYAVEMSRCGRTVTIFA